jgi:hypothetical protein
MIKAAVTAMSRKALNVCGALMFESPFKKSRRRSRAGKSSGGRGIQVQ